MDLGLGKKMIGPRSSIASFLSFSRYPSGFETLVSDLSSRFNLKIKLPDPLNQDSSSFKRCVFSRGVLFCSDPDPESRVHGRRGGPRAGGDAVRGGRLLLQLRAHRLGLQDGRHGAHGARGARRGSQACECQSVGKPLKGPMFLVARYF